MVGFCIYFIDSIIFAGGLEKRVNTWILVISEKRRNKQKRLRRNGQ